MSGKFRLTRKLAAKLDALGGGFLDRFKDGIEELDVDWQEVAEFLIPLLIQLMAKQASSNRQFEQYLLDSLENDVIDHVLRVSKTNDGTVSFYVHPYTASGETLDFVVQGNTLIVHPDVKPQ